MTENAALRGQLQENVTLTNNNKRSCSKIGKIANNNDKFRNIQHEKDKKVV